MTLAPFRDRLATVGTALRGQSDLRTRATWSRAQLEAFQRERLAGIVRHAAAHSDVYRARYAGLDLAGPIDLHALPAVTKPELMEDFDGWVTDPRLRRDLVERHLAGLTGDALLLGEHRVMATGGSTGTRGLFVFARAEWRELITHMMRMLQEAGATPRLPRRRRIAAVSAPGPAHMTWRIPASIDVGLHRRLTAPATTPLGELVAQLNAFAPDALIGYPSVLALLAGEQREGRLRIAPSLVSVSSELCTPEMREAIRAAWGVEPHEVYGATDGLWGWTCREGRLHLAEDLTIVEAVDAAGRPVPDGELADRLLITNLFMRTQPVIRYEVTDMVRFAAAPCPCGQPSRAVEAIEGRSDDVLTLPAAGGGTVRVHPIVVRAPLARLETVREYQVVLRPDGLHARVVARGDAGRADGEVRAALAGALRAGGAEIAVHVEVVPALDRDAATVGKLKLVRTELAPAG